MRWDRLTVGYLYYSPFQNRNDPACVGIRGVQGWVRRVTLSTDGSLTGPGVTGVVSTVGGEICHDRKLSFSSGQSSGSSTSTMISQGSPHYVFFCEFPETLGTSEEVDQ